MSLADAETIDVHAHAVLEETMGAAGSYGPELGRESAPRFRVGAYELQGVRYRGSPFMDPDLRVAAMDAAGLDYQVLSPNPLSYLHFIEPEAAQTFCRVHNDALSRVVAGHRQRLGAFAAVPMQDIGFAIEETARAVESLGMFGPYIGTDFGRPLDDPEMDIDDIVYSPGVARMRVMPYGDERIHSRLLAHDRMHDMLRAARSRYSDRFIVLDLPDVLDLGHARSVLGWVDATVLVVPYGVSDRRAVRLGIDAVGQNRLAGLVMNRVPG